MPIDEAALLRSLGARIRELRQARGLSLEALGHAAEVHPTYLSSVERGKRNPTVSVLARLAGALVVDVSALFAPAADRTADDLRTDLQRRLTSLEPRELARLLRLMDAAL